eukprot:8094036-Pyramimonas_sp.AAC.1
MCCGSNGGRYSINERGVRSRLASWLVVAFVQRTQLWVVAAVGLQVHASAHQGMREFIKQNARIR